MDASIGGPDHCVGAYVLDEKSGHVETIVAREGRDFYRYGDEERPVITSEIAVPYRAADGTIGAPTLRNFELPGARTTPPAPAATHRSAAGRQWTGAAAGHRAGTAAPGASVVIPLRSDFEPTPEVTSGVVEMPVR